MILDKFRLEGRNALVTGSRSVIGAARAIGLAQAGANVVVHGSRSRGSNDTEMDQVCAAVESLGRKAVRAVADLSDPEAAGELISLTIAELGSLDILINNAGTIRRSPAVDYSEMDWADVLSVNLDAVFRLCQLAGRRMIERGSGKIINIASMLSFQGGVLVPA